MGAAVSLLASDITPSVMVIKTNMVVKQSSTYLLKRVQATGLAQAHQIFQDCLLYFLSTKDKVTLRGILQTAVLKSILRGF